MDLMCPICFWVTIGSTYQYVLKQFLLGSKMPSDGCSVHMPFIIINSKLRVAEQDSVQYMMKVILTHIPVECGIVDSYVHRFPYGSG